MVFPEVRPYRRRSARLARHFNLALQWQDYAGETHTEPAETVFISRHGGLLHTTARTIKPGENAFLWWPEQKRGVPVRIVFRQLGHVPDLAELAFEFDSPEDFWGMNFPPDIVD